MRASWAVLRTHRPLFVYPLVSATVVAILGGLLPLALAWVHLFDERVDPGFSPRGIVAFIIILMVTSTVIVFCNVALVAEVTARFDGLPRSTPSGWSIARSELAGIVAYAGFASTLATLFLPIIVMDWAGRRWGIPLMLIPASWSLGTFLAVPVLVVERVRPREAVERGASLLRATWGDQFIGGFGITVIKVLTVTLVIAIGVVLIVLAALTANGPLVLIAVILVVVAVEFVLITASAVSMVFSAAAYRHATSGPIAGFEALDLAPGVVLATDATRR